MNRDGFLDLVAGNSRGDRTALYLNVRDATRDAPSWLGEPENTRSVALGDINGDGELDIVCGNDGRPNSLYTNRGGVLAMAPEWRSADNLRTTSLALGDLDQDGDLDLVCGNYAAGITAHTNVAGTLEQLPSWSSAVFDNTQCVALGDVDGDGFLDLVSGGYGQRARLYLNRGGVLDQNPTWSSNAMVITFSVALGDLDGDGDLDLVCGNFDQPNSVYSNVNGSFTLDPTWLSDEATRTLGVCLGDADGDGDLDLACASGGGRSVIYVNDGGVLATAPAWTSAVAQNQCLAFADIDGDGDLDLALGDWGGRSSVFTNESLPLETVPAWQSARPDSTLHVALGDIDSDGDLDLVCGNRLQSTTLYRNEGGQLADFPMWSSRRADWTGGLSLADLDGDNDLDLALGNWNGPSTMYLNSNGIFPDLPDWIADVSQLTVKIALGDLDLDGDMDLVCGNFGRSNVFENIGGTFGQSPVRSTSREDNTPSIALGDLDSDGDLDLACGNSLQPSTIYLNAAPEFERDPVWYSGPADSTYSVALGDVDNDGDLDLVTGNWGESALYVNDGGRMSLYPAWLSEPTRTLVATLADLDFDGDPDLLCGNREFPSTIYRNERGRFARTAAPFSAAGLFTFSIATGDVDLDGDVDVVLGNRARKSGLYLGRANPAFRGDPLAPRNQLPNSDAFVSRVEVVSTFTNRVDLNVTLVDVDSDPSWCIFEYRDALRSSWTVADIAIAPSAAAPSAIGPLPTSPPGVVHRFAWDLSRFPIMTQSVVLRVRCLSPPTNVGVMQRVPTYEKAMYVDVRRPVLTVSPAVLEMGSTTVGDTASAMLSLRNAGNEPLTVSSIGLPTNDLRISPTPPLVIAPGSEVNVVVYFAPIRPSVLASELSVVSNSPIAPTRKTPIQGSALGLEIEARPALLTGPVPLGQPLTVIVRPIATQARIERATLYYRRGAGDVFRPLALAASGTSFIGIVPGAEITETGLDLYAEAENSGFVERDPGNAPDTLISLVPLLPSGVTAVLQRTSEAGFLAGQAIPVRVGLPPGTTFVRGALHYRPLGRSLAGIDSLRAGDSGDVVASIPDSVVGPRGVQYWVDLRTRTLQLTDPATDPESRPHSIATIVLRLEESSTHPGLRYRMLSVPLDFGPSFQGSIQSLLSDESEFGPYDVRQWRAFRYVEGRGNVELSSDPMVFRPEPGRAFWLVSRETHRIDTAPISGSSVGAGGNVTVVVPPGWSQIGDPFAFDVAWESVQRSSNVLGPISYDGALYSATPAATLRPFEGYFVENIGAVPETLRVAAIEAVATHPQRVTRGWRAAIAVHTSDARDGWNVFGVDPAAVDGADALDVRKPPSPPGEWVHSAFAHPDWPVLPGDYLFDVRSSAVEGHAWDVELLASHVAEDVRVELRFLGARPDSLALQLIDPEQGVSQALEGSGPWEYRLLAHGPNTPYTLRFLAGSRTYVSREGAHGAIPSGVVIDRSAPNPFTGSTRLRFGISTTQRVALSIYDARGRLVQTLVPNQRLTAGYHAMIWDGRDASGKELSSGVYFARFQIGTRTFTRRLTHVK